jgi:hypothetical protein
MNLLFHEFISNVLIAGGIIMGNTKRISDLPGIGPAAEEKLIQAGLQQWSL